MPKFSAYMRGEGTVNLYTNNEDLSISTGSNIWVFDSNGKTQLPSPLEIEYGGTSATTVDQAWTNLGGGEIGKKDFLIADDIPSLTTGKIIGILPIEKGGTSATTIDQAWINLGGGEIGKKDFLESDDIPSLNTDKITGIFPIEKGGTGASTSIDALNNLGALPLTGGTLTGDITLNPNVKIKMGESQYCYIQSLTTTASYNPILLMQAGGNLILSGGEFGSNLLDADLDSVNNAGENLYIGADNTIRLYTNATDLSSTTTELYCWKLTNEGKTQLPSPLEIQYGGTGNTNGTAEKLTRAINIKTNLASTSTASFDGSVDITPGIMGILSTANGGTGNANGTVDKLTTARSIHTDLASTSTASFDGSANITPGVTGVLSTANGGTGNANGTIAKLTNARSIRTNLTKTSAASFDGSADITPGITGVLPTNNGGTGNSDGTIAKLTNARSIQTNLASTSAVNFDGSANITPGVTGTLSIEHGGTGRTTPTVHRLSIVKNSTGSVTLNNTTDNPVLVMVYFGSATRAMWLTNRAKEGSAEILSPPDNKFSITKTTNNATLTITNSSGATEVFHIYDFG